MVCGRSRSRGRIRYARVYNLKTGRMQKVKSGDRPIRVFSQKKKEMITIKIKNYRKFRRDEERAKKHLG